MFSSIRASFHKHQEVGEMYMKAEAIFLENRGEKADGFKDVIQIVSHPEAVVKENSSAVLHHWILDSAKIEKLLPIKYYVANRITQSFKVLEGKRIYFQADESDPEQLAFYEELAQESIKFGAVILNDASEADITVTQFVTIEQDRYFGYGSPFWLLRILCSATYKQPCLPLDYPCPLDPIKCDSPPVISLSGYSHEDREPLMAMITLAGGIYTAELTVSNTHIVSEGKETEKVKWAKIWNIPVHDRNWLERCFFQWEWLDK